MPDQGISASEIINYKGNAALSGGYAGDGTPTGIGSDIVTPFNKVMDTLNDQNFQWSKMKYDQAIKDRDSNQEEIAKQKIGPGVLDKDKPVIQKKIDELKDYWLKNPNLKANPKIWAESQKMVNEIQDMNNSSTSRDLEYKKQIVAAAADPIEAHRDLRLQHLDDQIKKGIEHPIDPFWDHADIDFNGLYPDVPLVQKGINYDTTGKDGVVKATKTSETPIDEFYKRFSPARLMAEPRTVQDIQKQHDTFDKVYGQDENYITGVNNKLNQINQSNKLGADDPRYLQPVATKQGDGYVVNDSPAQLAKSLYAFGKYKSITAEDADLADKYQKNLKMVSESKENQAQANLNNTKAFTDKFLAQSIKDKNEAEAYKYNQAGNKDAAEAADLKGQTSNSSAEALATFKTVENEKGYIPLSQAPKTLLPTLLPKIKAGLGIDDTWSIAKMPNVNQSIRKMLSEGTLDELTGKLTAIEKPNLVYAVKSPDGDPKKTKLIGIDKDGNVKAVDVYQASGEIVKFDQGYHLNDKTVKMVNAARKNVEDFQGDQSTQQEEQPASSSPASKRKAIPSANISTSDVRDNNGTTEVKVDGEWKKAIGKDSKGNIIVE